LIFPISIRSATVYAPLETGDILLGRSVSGLPYHVLDRMGFAIFEASSCAPPMLDGILSDFEQAQTKTASEQPLSPYPVETEEKWHYSYTSEKPPQALSI
jgi:hypothetical protein